MAENQNQADDAIIKRVTNAKKPGDDGGKELLERMNHSHNEMSLWALGGLEDREVKAALDIGCGGGQNLLNLAEKYPDAEIYGIDYSTVACKLAQETVLKSGTKSQIHIQEGTVSNLPFKNNSLDLVLACETIYFWPDIENDFKEVFRTIKPGGRFIVIVEDGYPGEGFSEHVKVRSLDEIEELMRNAGFSGFTGLRHRPDRWITAIGVKANNAF